MRALTCLAGALVALAFPALADARSRLVPLPSPMPPIVHGPCPDVPQAGGCAYLQPPFTIYINSNNRFSFEHELGHAFDRTSLSEGERNRFRSLIGKVGAPWWLMKSGELGGRSRSSIGEEFADAYANCAVGNYVSRWRHGINEQSWTASTPYFPSQKTHRRVCAFIRRAAVK